MKIVTTIALLLMVGSPALALFECWDEQTPESLVSASEQVVLGFVKDVKFVGCVLDDELIALCPDPAVGRLLPDYAYLIQFEVNRVLKGSDSRLIEFLLVVPALSVGCEGPGTAKGVKTIAFLQQKKDQQEAWGGDFAMYQNTRWDFQIILARVETASKIEQTDNIQE